MIERTTERGHNLGHYQGVISFNVYLAVLKALYPLMGPGPIFKLIGQIDTSGKHRGQYFARYKNGVVLSAYLQFLTFLIDKSEINTLFHLLKDSVKSKNLGTYIANFQNSLGIQEYLTFLTALIGKLATFYIFILLGSHAPKDSSLNLLIERNHTTELRQQLAELKGNLIVYYYTVEIKNYSVKVVADELASINVASMSIQHKQLFRKRQYWLKSYIVTARTLNQIK